MPSFLVALRRVLVHLRREITHLTELTDSSYRFKADTRPDPLLARPFLDLLLANWWFPPEH
jgi:hypothetical protein